MGGSGSGRRWRSQSTTNDYLFLDVRQLQRGEFLERRYSFLWKWSRRGEPAGSIQIRPEENQVTLAYSHNRDGHPKESKDYAVRLDRTECHFGGERVWFLCPAKGCGKRVAVLYGGEVFACRQCHQLVYQSQREAQYDRAGNRADAIRKRLRDEWGSVFEPAPPRPKGMHQRTYRRLARMYEAARYASLAGFGARIGMSVDEALEMG